MKINQLKAKYDSKPIADIEAAIRACQSDELTAHRKYIGILAYLEHTGRFKENPVYAKADFDIYLRECFDISMTKFRESKLLYVKFPDQAEKYGIGFVSRAAKQCGQDKLPIIFNALRREENKRSTPVSSEVKDAILDAHARPKKVIRYINWEARYREAAEEIQVLRAELAEKDKTIERLRAALAKTKGHSAAFVPVNLDCPRREAMAQ